MAAIKYGDLMKKFVFKTLAALAVSNHALAGAHDIAGVTIDLPLSTQRAAIAKTNPQYRITDLKENGRVVGIYAVLMKGPVAADEFVAMQDKKGIVWFIGRYQTVEKGERINPETLAASFKEKYGKSYSYSHVTTTNPNYEFDRKGNLYNGKKFGGQFNGPCSSMGFTTVHMIQVPTSYKESCGVIINTSAVGDGPDNMTVSYTVTIANIARMYDEVKSEQDEVQKLKQQERDAERSKNVKPKL
jgi:hypothetical protein